VASVDIPKLVQCRIDDKVRFRAITVQEAQKLYLDEIKELDEMRAIIHQPCKEVLDCRLVAKRLTKLFV
jgi:allophanate hydrolase subunit 2